MSSNNVNVETPSIIPSPFALVHEFHTTYGQPIRTTPVIDVPQRQMRVDLIIEEAEELEEANEQNDFIEIADALADLLYVTYGAAITHGLNPAEHFGTEASPVDFVREVVVAAGHEIPSKPTLEVEGRHDLVNMVKKAAEDYRAASEHGNINGLHKAIGELIVAAYDASLRFGLDIDDVLSEVQRSNMSKLGADGKPIYREDGKVLKGPNFFVPNIEEVLKRQGWEG